MYGVRLTALLGWKTFFIFIASLYVGVLEVKGVEGDWADGEARSARTAAALPMVLERERMSGVPVGEVWDWALAAADGWGPV